MKVTLSWLTYSSFDRTYEINNLPSMTIPDQTMTVQEILARHVRGLPILGQGKVPIYMDEDDDTIYPNQKLDLVDQQGIIDEVKRIPSLQKKLQDENKAAEIRRSNERKAKGAPGSKDEPGAAPASQEASEA